MEPSGLPIVDGSDLRYSAWKRYNIKTHFSIAHPQDSDNNPTLTYDDGYPVSWLYLDNSNNPVIALPLPIVPKGTNLVSENHFLEFNANKYIYLTEGWLPSSTEAVLFKVMDGVKDFQVVNNGSGHEITWLNPNTDVLDKVKLYAKTAGMPTGHDDPDAVLVHTVDNAVANESVAFIDTDPTRYGQTVYYAAFAFDSGVPTPNVSILSSHGSAKISPIIASLPTHVAKLNLSNVAYEFSNDGKINAFYSPTAVYPCNDNATSTDVIDIVSALNGTASANTDTMSTPAKIGSGLNLDGNKYISIPASDRLSFPYSYTLQGWFKRPLAGSNGCLISADGDRSTLRINTTTTTAQNVTVVGPAGTSVPSANFPYPLDWSDTDNFHFINLVKKGRTGTIYIDGNLAPIGWTDMSYYDSAFAWNVNSTGGVGGITYIGQQGMAYRFNGAVNDIEFYSYPLSKLQIKYSYNNGNGRMFDPAFYNYAHIDGMAIISDAGAAGERALLPLKGDEFSRNLSGMNALNVDCYSLRAGNIFSIVFINEAGVEFVGPVTITTAKAWETVSLDISGIQNTVKQNIKKIGIRVDNADEVNIISIKNIVKA
jgi:hypothetical protein